MSDPTHAYIMFCPHCGGVDGAYVDDAWEGLEEVLRECLQTGRMFNRVPLPVKLSCACNTPHLPFTLTKPMFDESEFVS
jgi:hypothetical protein